MEGVLLDQILVGCAASLANLIIHAVLLGGVGWTGRRLAVRGAVCGTVRLLAVSDMLAPAFLQYTLVIVATGTLLVAGHFSEVVVWAYTYAWVGAAPPDTDLTYFAFGNYTTLGYGDVIPVPAWHMLGPMTALNGIMLIGWATALIIEVLRRTGTATATKNRHPAGLAQ